MQLPANHDLLSIMEEVIAPQDRIMESLIMKTHVRSHVTQAINWRMVLVPLECVKVMVPGAV